ncbi:hypothetical protein [Bdellovibrio reynosensis]|uniref:Uncharacterized protein n=1 Tax=Bdellovibrio reynosensis TaxID=2835041 RepID=A0ABY4C7Z8_9BACT|nr:hypothetical protein [Bdellovibrio reynosensis]UOF00849.1 hypothetical protein MNR06_14200 [Bdellovibrio reynosensis]
MKTLLLHSFSLVVSLSLLGACAPKPEDRIFPAGKTSFGPRLSDTDLFQKGLKTHGQEVKNLNWQTQVSTADFFQSAEHLVHLGQTTENEALKNKGLQWIERFYEAEGSSSFVELSQSPFANLAAAQTQTEVKKTLEEINLEIARSQKIIKEQFERIGAQFPWPAKTENLPKLLAFARSFTDRVQNTLPEMGLESVIEEGITEELKAETDPLFVEFENLIHKMQRAVTLSQNLTIIEAVIAKFQITLDPELNRSLAQGKLIASGLDNMHDAQGGLTVIVDIWRILTPEEKATYIKDGNEELYDFLSRQNNDELECLRTSGCGGGIFDGIAKKLFVLPKIKKYGLEKLQAEMNEKTRGYVISVIETFGTNFIKELPKLFIEKINLGLQEKGKEVLSVRNNYPNYLKRLLMAWSKKVLPSMNGKIRGFEVNQVSVKISSQGFTLEPQGNFKVLKATTVGSSLVANSLLMENANEKNPESLQGALTQVNKLVSIGGYRDGANYLIPALLTPVKKGKRNLDIMDLALMQSSYAIPDEVPLKDAFHGDGKASVTRNFSASSFANQLYGISRMMRLTADWKHTKFDKILGNIQAQDITQDIESDALHRPLFPKDMLFALNLGEAAVLLQNITKEDTPVFLVTLENKIMGADKFTTSDETAVMAAIQDILDTGKGNVVKSRDVAHLILAIAEFLEATEGVENTRSEILLEVDKRGLRPLDILLEGREDLKLLTLGLANFLTNKFTSSTGLIQEKYDIEKQSILNPGLNLEDQAYAVRALLKAWKLTNLEVYLWAAQDIYYSLNKNSFNKDEFFYRNSDGSNLEFPQKLHIIRALTDLRPHLDAKSQQQSDKILKPWLEALGKLK